MFMCIFVHTHYYNIFITGTTQKITIKKEHDSFTQDTTPVHLQHAQVSLHMPQSQAMIFVHLSLYYTLSHL